MPRVLEKKERSLGAKLSIRGERCESPKCAVIRRPYRPGQHGKRYRNLSDFGLQLQEKQKIRFSYGLSDKELGKLLKKVSRKSGELTPDALVETLESRLDNVVYRLGFTPSRSVARHLVSHGHFTVNGRRVTTSSYQVKPNDVISIRVSSRDLSLFQGLNEKIKNYEPPVWLALDREKLEGKVTAKPKALDLPFDINLVVDYYSK